MVENSYTTVFLAGHELKYMAGFYKNPIPCICGKLDNRSTWEKVTVDGLVAGR